MFSVETSGDTSHTSKHAQGFVNGLPSGFPSLSFLGGFEDDFVIKKECKLFLILFYTNI